MAAKKETAAPAASSDKKKAIETAMQQIEKMYGRAPSCAMATATWPT